MPDERLPRIGPRSTPLPQDFPGVFVHSSAYAGIRENEPAMAAAYHAAKREGNTDAAVTWARRLFKFEIAEQLAEIAGTNHPIILPVIGRERADGTLNKIPLGFAHVLQDYSGWVIEDQIIREASSSRTTLDTLDRLIEQPTFGGQVYAGRKYIVLDDHLTLGGTIRNVIDHVQSQGGDVIATTTLASRLPDAQLMVSPKLETGLNQIKGGAFVQFHDEFFGIERDLPKRIPRHEIFFTFGEAGLITRYEGGIETLRSDLTKRISEKGHAGAAGRSPEGSEKDVPQTREPSDGGRRRSKGKVKFGGLVGMAVGPGLTLLATHDANAALESGLEQAPLIGEGMALKDGRYAEAGLRGLEEIPLAGFATSPIRDALNLAGVDVDGGAATGTLDTLIHIVGKEGNDPALVELSLASKLQQSGMGDAIRTALREADLANQNIIVSDAAVKAGKLLDSLPQQSDNLARPAEVALVQMRDAILASEKTLTQPSANLEPQAQILPPRELEEIRHNQLLAQFITMTSLYDEKTGGWITDHSCVSPEKLAQINQVFSDQKEAFLKDVRTLSTGQTANTDPFQMTSIPEKGKEPRTR